MRHGDELKQRRFAEQIKVSRDWLVAERYLDFRNRDLFPTPLQASKLKIAQSGPVAKIDDLLQRLFVDTRDGDEADWETLLRAWRDDIEQLVAAFRAGAAMLDPKYGNTTCQNCEQALLCRRIELALIDTDEREDDADVE